MWDGLGMLDVAGVADDRRPDCEGMDDDDQFESTHERVVPVDIAMKLEDGAIVPREYWTPYIPPDIEEVLVDTIAEAREEEILGQKGQSRELSSKPVEYPMELAGSTVLAILFLGGRINTNGNVVVPDMAADLDLYATSDIINRLKTKVSVIADRGDKGQYPRVKLSRDRPADLVSYTEMWKQNREAVKELYFALQSAKKMNLSSEQEARVEAVLNRLREEYYEEPDNGGEGKIEDVIDLYKEVPSCELAARRGLFVDQGLTLGLRVVEDKLEVVVNDPGEFLQREGVVKTQEVGSQTKQFNPPFLEISESSLAAMALEVIDVLSTVPDGSYNKRPLIALEQALGKTLVRVSEQGMPVDFDGKSWQLIERVAWWTVETDDWVSVREVEHPKDWLKEHIIRDLVRACATDAQRACNYFFARLPLAYFLDEKIGEKFAGVSKVENWSAVKEDDINHQANQALRLLYKMFNYLYQLEEQEVNIIDGENEMWDLRRKVRYKKAPESMSEILALLFVSMYLSFDGIDTNEVESMVDDVVNHWPAKVYGKLKYVWWDYGDNCRDCSFEIGVAKQEIMQYFTKVINGESHFNSLHEIKSNAGKNKS
jgi:hypothetical protein